MHLVDDHVLELLVEHGPKEHVAPQRQPRDAGRQELLAGIVVAVLHQHLAARRDTVAGEGGAVATVAIHKPSLASQQLDHLAHRHTRREAVRVHDQVGANAFIGERQVLLRHDQPAHTLLPVAGAELVAQLRPPDLTHEHLDQLLAVAVGGEQHLVHIAADGALVAEW